MSNAKAMSRTPVHLSVLRVLALVAVGAAAASVQASPVIYDQPVNLTADPIRSQTDQLIWDDFVLANGGTITDVHWTGGFTGAAENTFISNGFTLGFWAAGTNAPGSFIAGETFTGTAHQINGRPCTTAWTCFDYSVDLTTPFVAAAGTTYWLSIHADQSFPPRWGWAQGSGGNGLSFGKNDEDEGRLDGDRAFALTGRGSSVPEPATLALLGVGLAGLGLARRRKQS